jgi:hypothetical protein
MSFLLGLTVAGLLAGPPQQAPSGDPNAAAAQATPAPAEELPVSLRRIQRSLSRPPKLRVESEKPVFRMEIFGRKPTIEDILGPDYLRGPVSGGAMTHHEFLAMVTPKDVQGYAAFSNGQGLTVAATSIALQWALQKAIHKLSEAKQDRDREAARREVMDAMSALQEARRRAGLDK